MRVQYVPYVGDSKRAMDEYTSEIFMGGRNTIVMHNTCEDSLLAAPLILDLVLLAELCTRIEFKTDGQASHPCAPCFHPPHPILYWLAFTLACETCVRNAEAVRFMSVASTWFL